MEREARIGRAVEIAHAVRLQPDRETIREAAELGMTLSEETTLARLCRRPEIDSARLFAWAASRDPRLDGLAADEIERTTIALRYDGLLERERETATRLARSDEVAIPETLAYAGLPGLSSRWSKSWSGTTRARSGRRADSRYHPHRGGDPPRADPRKGGCVSD